MKKSKHKQAIFDGILDMQLEQFKVLHKKKNMAKLHWTYMENQDLLELMEEKFNELWNLSNESRDRKRQRQLCVHVANFAMMLMDNLKR